MIPVLWCLLLLQPAVSDYQRGLEAYSRDDLAAAEAHLKQACRRDPRLFRARFLLGATLVRLHRRQEAIAELEAAHRLDPRQADVVKLLAIQYMDGSRHAEALHLLSGVPDTTRDEETYLLLIEINQTAGSIDEAGRLIRRALGRYPQSAPLNAWMGYEMRESGRFAEARSRLEKALRLEPGLVSAQFLMGDVLLRQEKYSEALPWLRKALAADPGDVDAAIDVSRAWTGLGEPRAGLAELERARRLSPESARLAVELSKLYFRLGERESARREAEIGARLFQKENPVPESLRHR